MTAERRKTIWRDLKDECQDPCKFQRIFWPDVELYNKQREILYSVRDNYETIVHAGNELGKDFVAGLCVLWFFLTRQPCRIVTTSADHKQLEGVLWGEIRRFIQTSAIPLESTRGGPLVCNHLHIRKMYKGKLCPISYIIARVAKKGEGMLGHHATPKPEGGGTVFMPSFDDGIPRTMFVADEASGVDDLSYDRATTWAKRILCIGNPFPCTNFFHRNIKEGSLDAEGNRLLVV